LRRAEEEWTMTNWIPVLWNLSDARGELALLLARVQHAVFGEIVSVELKYCEELASTENRERPLTEGRLLLSMDYVYKHLNRAWNGRNAPMETVDRRERTDVSCWERFPTHAIFADLRQPPRTRRSKPPRVAWNGRIAPNSIHPYLQYAMRKLEVLYYLAKLQHGVKGEPRPERPAGVSDKIEAIPLDEAELGRRLHRIYRELNYAWAIRKPRRDRSGNAPTRATMRRQDRFPRVFPF